MLLRLLSLKSGTSTSACSDACKPLLLPYRHLWAVEAVERRKGNGGRTGNGKRGRGRLEGRGGGGEWRGRGDRGTKRRERERGRNHITPTQDIQFSHIRLMLALLYHSLSRLKPLQQFHHSDSMVLTRKNKFDTAKHYQQVTSR